MNATELAIGGLDGCTVACPTEPREAWLTERRKGIGSSDAPVILFGKAHGTSVHDLFLEKIGLSEDEVTVTPRMRWGTLLEPLIREDYVAEMGRRVEPCGQMLRRKDRPWQQATPDGFVFRGPTNALGVFEMKTSGRSEWDDGVPPDILAQVDHQLAVTGLPFATVAVLRFGFRGIDDRYHLDIERDEERIRVLLEAEDEFWGRVTDRVPPPVDETEACAKALGKRYREVVEGKQVQLSAALLDADATLVNLKVQRKELEARILLAENTIKAAIGDAESGLLPDGTLYRWPTITVNVPPQPARTSQYRRLYRKEAN